MKELTLEEKAKRYDEALEKARNILDSTDDNYVCTYLTKEDIKGMYSRFFPELAESEDEKIRKSLIHYLHGLGEFEYPDEKTYNNWLVWLEKQSEPNPYSGVSFEYKGNTWGMCARDNGVEILLDGELKAFVSLEKSFVYPIHPQPELEPKSALEAIKEEKVDNANKVEPKFQNGQWITNGDYTWKIVEVKPLDYILQSQDGNIVDDTISHVDEQFHSFTIKDAKDGDVLIDKSGSREGLFIFKETKPSDIKTDVLNNPLTVLGYCGIGGAGFTKGSGWGDTANCTYYPATKEQRDTLFKAMADAGYTFDFEKKELKKISQRMISAEAKEAMYGKPTAWSEEDEQRVENLLAIIEGHGYPGEVAWLKSIKQRMG